MSDKKLWQLAYRYARSNIKLHAHLHYEGTPHFMDGFSIKPFVSKDVYHAYLCYITCAYTCLEARVNNPRSKIRDYKSNSIGDSSQAIFGFNKNNN
jgi:hypothetical protein